MSDKPRRRKIPWTQLRDEYIASPTLTLRALADRHSVDRRTVQKRSKSEDWAQMRLSFQNRVSARIQETILEGLCTAVRDGTLEAVEDRRKVRRRAAEFILKELNATSELQPEEERIVLIKKTESGETIRKETRSRRGRPDPRWIAEFVRSEAILLEILARLSPPDTETRTIEIQ